MLNGVIQCLRLRAPRSCRWQLRKPTCGRLSGSGVSRRGRTRPRRVPPILRASSPWVLWPRTQRLLVAGGFARARPLPIANRMAPSCGRIARCVRLKTLRSVCVRSSNLCVHTSRRKGALFARETEVGPIAVNDCFRRRGKSFRCGEGGPSRFVGACPGI